MKGKAIAVLAAILAVIGLVLGGFAIYASLAPGLADALDVSGANRKDDFYSFVLCGLDADGQRTDTIMVGAFDAANNSISIVSVPRDTMINVDWNTKKINSSYSVGGSERLITELKRILGFTVDFYAVIDMEAFVAVVDEIDGVDFDVPERMYKDDPYIDLQPGLQTLNGQQALQLVRYRDYPMGDIARVEVQQSFIKALASQTLKASNILKISSFASIFKEYVDTDLSTGNLIWLGSKLLSIDTEDISFYTLPGDSSAHYGGLSYHCLYIDQVLTLVNSCLNPYTTDITADMLDILTMSGGYLVTNAAYSGSGSASYGSSGSVTEPTSAPAATAVQAPVQTPEQVEIPEAEVTPEPVDESQPVPLEEPVEIPVDEPIPEVTEDASPETSPDTPESEDESYTDMPVDIPADPIDPPDEEA